jgi:hypothetical protein
VSGTVFVLLSFFNKIGCLASEINIGFVGSILEEKIQLFLLEYFALAKIESMYAMRIK